MKKINKKTIDIIAMAIVICLVIFAMVYNSVICAVILIYLLQYQVTKNKEEQDRQKEVIMALCALIGDKGRS